MSADLGGNILDMNEDALSAGSALLGAGYSDEMEAWLAPEKCGECGEPNDDFGRCECDSDEDLELES